MRICLYSPYFPKHTGGGEKYLLDTAEALTHYGEVSLAIAGSTLSTAQRLAMYKKQERFIGHSLRQLKLIPSPLGTDASVLEKLSWTKQFDLLYAITDGSFFASLAKRSVMHIQIPLLRAPLTSAERLKKLTWQFVNTNSAFTKRVVESTWKLHVDAVHYPMIDVLPLEKLAEHTQKQKIILHVGRFFRQLHSKRQDVLVTFFKHLLKKYPKESKGWQLVLIGSVEDEAYAASVRKMAKGLPIKIIHTVSRAQLNQWYAKASLYWHATGFGLSEMAYPAHMEHFGISTVEAMAAGTVPIVIGKGGQPEALGDGLKELLWQDEKTCLAKTAECMNNTAATRALAQQAQLRSQQFDRAAFEANIQKMMKQLGF